MRFFWASPYYLQRYLPYLLNYTRQPTSATTATASSRPPKTMFPWKKKTALELIVMSTRYQCSVFTCMETATRIFTKDGLSACLCPFHQRFVAALPLLYGCQYTPSLIDEHLRHRGEHVVDSPDDDTVFTIEQSCFSNEYHPPYCSRRATIIVPLGEYMWNCRLYLFCDSHSMETYKQYSERISSKVR